MRDAAGSHIDHQHGWLCRLIVMSLIKDGFPIDFHLSVEELLRRDAVCCYGAVVHLPQLSMY